MPLFPETPVRLHFRGTLRQRTLDGLMSAAVDADGVLLVPVQGGEGTPEVVRVPFELLDGVTGSALDGGTLVLYLRDDERSIGTGDPRAEALADEIVRRACVLPEVTRAVRTLRAHADDDARAALLTPLLAARRHASDGGSAAIAAFDAAALRLALEHLLARVAAEREPARPAAQRALEARLCDAAEPLLQALVPLEHAAAAVRTADPGVALRAWRGWVHALRAVFERVDAAAAAVETTLAAARAAAAQTPAAGTPLDPFRRWVP